jgi:SAM-dependent methyltransferase
LSKTFTHPVDIKLLETLLDKESIILDYGCGYGRIVKQLYDLGFINVIGFDTSGKLIDRGKRENDLPIFYIENPIDLPIENNSVDCILLFAVLTCIPSNNGQLELIKLISSKLKKGGILYISDYYLQDNSTEVNKYQYLNKDEENFGVFALEEGVTCRHHTKEWIMKLISSFTVLSEINIEVKTMNGNLAKAFQLLVQK